jgi:hypothetical protein
MDAWPSHGTLRSPDAEHDRSEEGGVKDEAGPTAVKKPAMPRPSQYTAARPAPALARRRAALALMAPKPRPKPWLTKKRPRPSPKHT